MKLYPKVSRSKRPSHHNRSDLSKRRKAAKHREVDQPHSSSDVDPSRSARPRSIVPLSASASRESDNCVAAHGHNKGIHCTRISFLKNLHIGTSFTPKR